MSQEQPLVHIKLDVEEVRAALAQAWLDRFGTEANPRSICLLLAQIAQETGMTECRNWNLGNVKAAIGGSVDWCVFKTWEVVHGVKKDEVLAFRSFASLEEGAAFYIGFLAAHEPDAWPAVLSGDPDAFAHGLKLDRYYTADEAEYAAGVRSRLHFYWTHLVQALLAGAGYPVKVDGFAGPQTSLAVVHFQGANGLPGTGVADDATVAALERAQVVPAPDTIPDVA